MSLWKRWAVAPLMLLLSIQSAQAGESLQFGGEASARNSQQGAVVPSEDWQLRIARLEQELAALKNGPGYSSFQNASFAPPVPSVGPPHSYSAGCAELGCTDPGCAGGYGACGAAGAAKFPTVKVSGFFHLDAGFYSQDATNQQTLGDIEDGVGFRRARLGATGNVTEHTSYLMEFDFAQAQARFVDVWMQFSETPAGNIRIGRFRQPFGMDELTSVRELPFLERSTGFALAPFRQTGIMLFDTAADERITWALSGYRYLSDNFGNDYADTGGYGLATRISMLPIDCGDEQLFHVGFDYSYNNPGRDEVQYVSTNEFFVGQNTTLGPGGLSVLPIVAVPPFVNTGIMDTQHTNLFNVEAAASWGNFLIQSEARWAMVEQNNGVSNTFPAAYVQARYMLTGEVIPYNRKGGVFGRVKPTNPVDLCCGNYGAWELAGRVSYIDLNGTGIPGPGRHLTDTTLGVNWYLNNFTKFQCNYIHAELDDNTFGGSSAETLAFRGQLDF